MTVYRLPAEPDTTIVWVVERIWDLEHSEELTEVTRWIRTADGWDDDDYRCVSWARLLELGDVHDEEPPAQ